MTAPRSAAALGVRPDDPSITGALHDPFAPDLRHPPMDWFFEPPEWFNDATKIWVDSDGRAAGWYYQAGVCIIDGNENDCWSPSPSLTGNELFHQGSIIAMDGDTPTIVETGVIGGGGEHAPTWMTAEQAADYYADVNRQLLIGRIYDDPGRGGYFLGAILPEAQNAQVDMIRRSALSGDWRWRRQDLSGHTLNAYDAIGPWLVTRPGLPLMRTGQTVLRLASVAGAPPVMVLGEAAAICGPLDVNEYDPEEEAAMWHIENQGDAGYAVIESRSGAIESLHDTIPEAQSALGRLFEPRPAAVNVLPEVEEQPNQGAANMDTPTEVEAPAEPETAAPAPDPETSARVDALEQRVADLEAMCAEMMTADLAVDDIMPAEMI